MAEVALLVLTEGAERGLLDCRRPYGNILSETNPAAGDRFKYTGREWDSEIGLQYNRARYCDPRIGRWISEDPIRERSGDLNFYRYVNNMPVNATDPSGESIFLALDLLSAHYDGLEAAADAFLRYSGRDPVGAIIGAYIVGFQTSLLIALGVGVGIGIAGVGLKVVGRAGGEFFGQFLDDILESPLGFVAKSKVDPILWTKK